MIPVRWPFAFLALALTLSGCSTSPPNLALGLLADQNDSLFYTFVSVDYLANMGATGFSDSLRPSGEDPFPTTFRAQQVTDVYSIAPGPWVLLALASNEGNPSLALGVNAFNQASLAYVPTYSLQDWEWYSAVQLNLKLFRYAAVSASRYQEQFVSTRPMPGTGFLDSPPIRKRTLNEAALTLFFPFDFFGRPMAYAIVPKYTWSDRRDIQGAGVSTVVAIGHRPAAPGSKKR